VRTAHDYSRTDKPQIDRDDPQAKDGLVSALVNDPLARHARKPPGNRRDGYRAHLAARGETGIITGEQLTKVAGRKAATRPSRGAAGR
jgi:hypothetical protein